MVLSLVVSASAVCRQENGQAAVPSNLMVLQKLLGNVSRAILRGLAVRAGDSILLRVGGVEESWIVSNAVVAEMKSESLQVFQPAEGIGGARYVLDITHAEVNVRYAGTFTESMFGAKKVQREVNAGFSSQVIDMRTNEIRYSGSLNDAQIDTVLIDEIERIETPGVKSTHAAAPPATLLDKIVEPFVIIGATGVAIYLLFHVRT